MFDKLNIGKIFLEKLGDMFGHMLGAGLPVDETGSIEEDKHSQDDYVHDNILFEQQSKVGRSKGEMISPEPMRKQINNFYRAKNEGLIKKGVVVLDNTPDEENTLG